jgi:hypothetical protein
LFSRVQFDCVQTRSVCSPAYSLTASRPGRFVLPRTVLTASRPGRFVLPRTVRLRPDQVGLFSRVQFDCVQYQVGLFSRPRFHAFQTEFDCSLAYSSTRSRSERPHSTSTLTAPSFTARLNVCAGLGLVSEARLLSCHSVPPSERARNCSACNHAAARKGRPTAIPNQASQRPHRTQTQARPLSSPLPRHAADSHEVLGGGNTASHVPISRRDVGISQSLKPPVCEPALLAIRRWHEATSSEDPRARDIITNCARHAVILQIQTGSVGSTAHRFACLKSSARTQRPQPTVAPR